MHGDVHFQYDLTVLILCRCELHGQIGVIRRLSIYSGNAGQQQRQRQKQR